MNDRVLVVIPSVFILVRLCFTIPTHALSHILRDSLRIDLQCFVEDCGFQSSRPLVGDSQLFRTSRTGIPSLLHQCSPVLLHGLHVFALHYGGVAGDVMDAPLPLSPFSRHRSVQKHLLYPLFHHVRPFHAPMQAPGSVPSVLVLLFRVRPSSCCHRKIDGKKKGSDHHLK